MIGREFSMYVVERGANEYLTIFNKRIKWTRDIRYATMFPYSINARTEAIKHLEDFQFKVKEVKCCL